MKRSYYLPRSHNLSLVRYMGADASSQPEEAHITCDKLISAFSTAKMHTKDSNQGEHSTAGAPENKHRGAGSPCHSHSLSVQHLTMTVPGKVRSTLYPDRISQLLKFSSMHLRPLRISVLYTGSGGLTTLGFRSLTIR